MYPMGNELIKLAGAQWRLTEGPCRQMRQLPLPTQQHSQSALGNLKPSTACPTVPTGSSPRRSGHGLLLAQQVDLLVQGLDLQLGLYVHLVSALDDKAQAPKCIRDRAGSRRRVSMFTGVCLNGRLNPGSPQQPAKFRSDEAQACAANGLILAGTSASASLADAASWSSCRPVQKPSCRPK